MNKKTIIRLLFIKNYKN